MRSGGEQAKRIEDEARRRDRQERERECGRGIEMSPGVVPGDVTRECAEEPYPAKVVSGSPRTPGILTAKSDPESGALLSMSSVSRTRALVT